MSLGEAADKYKLAEGAQCWMQTRLCALKMGLSASNTKAFIAGVSERKHTVYRLSILLVSIFLMKCIVNVPNIKKVLINRIRKSKSPIA